MLWHHDMTNQRSGQETQLTSYLTKAEPHISNSNKTTVVRGYNKATAAYVSKSAPNMQ